MEYIPNWPKLKELNEYDREYALKKLKNREESISIISGCYCVGDTINLLSACGDERCLMLVISILNRLGLNINVYHVDKDINTLIKARNGLFGKASNGIMLLTHKNYLTVEK